MESEQDTVAAEGDDGIAETPGAEDSANAEETAMDDTGLPDKFGFGVIGDEDLSAVIRMSGKQYLVRTGSVHLVPYCDVLDNIVVEDVLLATNQQTLVGTPTIEGARVTLDPVDVVVGPKVISFKKRRRKHSSKTTKGSRKIDTVFRVTSIEVPGLGESKLGPVDQSEQLATSN